MNWGNITTNNAGVAAESVINLSRKVIDGVSITTSNANFTNNDGTNNWLGLAANGGNAPAEFVDSVTTDIAGNFNLGDGFPDTVVVSGLDASLAYKIEPWEGCSCGPGRSRISRPTNRSIGPPFPSLKGFF